MLISQGWFRKGKGDEKRVGKCNKIKSPQLPRFTASKLGGLIP